MKWTDGGIKAAFSELALKDGGISLSLDIVDNLWIPDFYVYNISDYKAFADSTQITRLKILSENPFYENKTMVEYRMESKAMVYCEFALSRYPLDYQNCVFGFGSQANDVQFVLYDVNHTCHQDKKYQAVEFDVSVSLFEDTLNQTLDKPPVVGFNIKIDRIISPFLFKYYLPCFAIVAASQISFIIPLSAIPGRVALMVTQFLTLTNLFIYQMVHNIFHQ